VQGTYPFEPSDERLFDHRKIFVGGLSSETTEADLKEYFSVYGNLTDIVVMRGVRGLLEMLTGSARRVLLSFCIPLAAARHHSLYLGRTSFALTICILPRSRQVDWQRAWVRVCDIRGQERYAPPRAFFYRLEELDNHYCLPLFPLRS
jgi:hypothetical protein